MPIHIRDQAGLNNERRVPLLQLQLSTAKTFCAAEGRSPSSDEGHDLSLQVAPTDP